MAEEAVNKYTKLVAFGLCGAIAVESQGTLVHRASSYPIGKDDCLLSIVHSARSTFCIMYIARNTATLSSLCDIELIRFALALLQGSLFIADGTHSGSPAVLCEEVHESFRRGPRAAALSLSCSINWATIDYILEYFTQEAEVSE